MRRASLRPGCFAPREECRDAIVRFLPGAHLRDALGGLLEHLGIGCAAPMKRPDEPLASSLCQWCALVQRCQQRRELLLERIGIAVLMDQAQAQRLRRIEALTGLEVAARRALADGLDQVRGDCRGRESEAHLGGPEA